MPYEVQVAESAAKEMRGLAFTRQEPLLNRLRKDLSERPEEAGTALRGALRKYRVIVQPATYAVVYRIDEQTQTVQILQVRVVM